MQLLARRDEQMKEPEVAFLSTPEIDMMAPLTIYRPRSPPPPPSPSVHVNVVGLGDGRGSAGSGEDTPSEKSRHIVIVEPEPIIRRDRVAHRSSRIGADVCCVCMEEYGEEDLVRETPCTHVFHGACLERWLVGYDSRCPLCQTNLKANAN